MMSYVVETRDIYWTSLPVFGGPFYEIMRKNGKIKYFISTRTNLSDERALHVNTDGCKVLLNHDFKTLG